MSMVAPRTEPDTTGHSKMSEAGQDRTSPLRGVRPCPGVRTDQRPAAGGLSSLSFAATEALRKYSKDTERSETTRDADKRLDARQSLAAASDALGPRHKAIVDLVLIKGRKVSDLALMSGQSVDALNRLLTDAAETLADHYQSRRAA